VVENGQHLIKCHKMVLDACSDYFANFLKNKLLDDKSNLVICLPKEIKLWEIQAILQYMYHGQVCVNQEGLPSLVKCAEILQVKGLCGNGNTSITSANKESSAAEVSAAASNNGQHAIELDGNESDAVGSGGGAGGEEEYNDHNMIIKQEHNISE